MDEEAIVVDIDIEIVEEEPPLLFDLTALQIEANRRFGLSAVEVSKCTQSLYEAELLTYPRTSSRYITADMADNVSALLTSGETGNDYGNGDPPSGGNNGYGNGDPPSGGNNGYGSGNPPSGGDNSYGNGDPPSGGNNGYGNGDPPSGGNNGYGNSDSPNERNFTNVIDVKFKCGPTCDKDEFARQLHNQQEGMKRLTIFQYIENRAKYKQHGRAKEGNEAQKNARDKAREDKINELRAQGMSRKDAIQEAEKWLKTQAALHDPDQIAGGDPQNVTGMGDKKVNSSIGSQWRTRISAVDKAVEEFVSKLTLDEQKSTYLNMNLHT